MIQLSFWTRLRHLLITSRWERWLSNALHRSLRSHSDLAPFSWADLGIQVLLAPC